MVMFTYKPGSRVKVESGEYLGELISVTENPEGKFGPSVRFVFKIIGGDFDGVVASVLAKADWSPGSKVDSIVRALGVEPLEFGENFESDNLLGRQAKIYVEPNEKNGHINNNVTKYRAVKMPGSFAPAVEQPSKPAVHQAPTQPAAPVQPQSAPGSIGTKEVKEAPRTPTGVNVVDEISF